MANLQTYKNILSNAKPLLKLKYPIKNIAFFGSLTRNDFNESKSDIDILIELNGEMDWNYFDLCFELQALFPDKKVDVVSRNAIQPHYWKYIKNDVVYV
jgi:predicted nucleotidyltransferase